MILLTLSIPVCDCNQLQRISKDSFKFIATDWLNWKARNVIDRISAKGQIKTILIFTGLFERQEWPNLKSAEGNSFLKKHGCPVTNCRLKYNTGDGNLHGADIVLFHDRDMPDGFTLKDMSETARPGNQIWVYFTGENPEHSHHVVGHLDGLFDWTMTYKHNSDIWLPYFRFFPKKTEKSNSITNYATRKKHLIAWLASDCGQMRERVVFELQKIMPVHVGGKCSSMYPEKIDCESNKECDKKIKEFKFYLAFENKLCDDYVTEKYWYRSIKNDVVPVVLGGSAYSNPKVAIPGSYINVLDFKNIDLLAKYLKYLDNNDTAYNEYFKWKEKYSLWEPVCDWPFEPYWACQMCIRLNQGIKRKNKVKMSQYWSAVKNCKVHEKHVSVFLENSGHDFQSFHIGKQDVQNPYNEISKELDYEEVMNTKNDIKSIPIKAEKEDVYNEYTDTSEMFRLKEYGKEDYEEYSIFLLFSLATLGFMCFVYKMHFRL